MTATRKFLQDLHTHSDDQPCDTAPSWGFTIYRTHYGPESETNWSGLLETIASQTKQRILSTYDLAEESPKYKEICSLFRLNTQSDASTLDGLGRDQVRQIHLAIPSHATNSAYRSRRVFLLADEDVLTGQYLGWLKCVDLDYQETVYDPQWNSRGMRQRYFGWTKMTTGSVLGLWNESGDHGLECIAPPSVGGEVLEIWESAAW